MHCRISHDVSMAKIVVYKKGSLDLAKAGFGKAREKSLDLKQLKARAP